MLRLPDKSSVNTCCLKVSNFFHSLPGYTDKVGSLWDSSLANTNQGVVLLILAMCLYKLSKLMVLQKLLHNTRAWLNGSHIDKRIDSLTSDLRMEMRELSEQIIEFQKWSKVNFDEPAPKSIGTCKLCKKRAMVSEELPVLKRNTYYPPAINNDLSECNWLQYLHKYVYNPNPRILDTCELGNIKRAYSDWFQY